MIMEKINVVINGENKEYDKNISLEKLAHEYQGNYEHRIILAKVNGKLRELFKKVKTDNSEIEFVTLNTKIGYMTYQRSAIFLMLKAIYDVYGKQKVLDVRVQHSLSKGLYCDFKGELKADEEFIKKVIGDYKVIDFIIEYNLGNCVRAVTSSIFMRRGLRLRH